MFASADKTQNYYEITKDTYNKILYDNMDIMEKCQYFLINKNDKK